jgi:carboxylesterase type B
MAMLQTLVALVFLNFVNVLAVFDTDDWDMLNYDNTSIVFTRYGVVRGFKYDLEDGSQADIFLKVPYAKPPLGDLRFEKPEAPEPWFGIKDATNWPLACPPASLGTADVSTNNEDCLYLNIFRPSRKLFQRPPGGYPVLVWIHGGSNVIGSTQQFGYKNLSQLFVPQGIIVVSVQYRLGPWGFASTGDDVMPGNLGLWDMTEAAKFLNKVVGQFGGNPKKITLWGLSSSAIDLGAVGVSPHMRDYFHQIVQQSGSPWNRGISNEGIQWTTQLANQLGCDTSTSVAIKACLKATNFTAYWAALGVLGLTNLQPLSMSTSKYLARIDGDFFPHNLTEMYANARPYKSYIGTGSAEAALYSVFGNLFSPFSPYVLQKAQWPGFGESNFTNFVWNVVIDQRFYGNGSDRAGMAQAIIDFYTSDKTNTSDYVYWITKYTQLISDYIFGIPLLIECREKAALGWTTYLYQNQHYSQYLYDQIDLNPPLRGSHHTNEYSYQFGFFNLGIVFPMDENERKFQKALADTIGQFVKTGNPSTSYLTWPKITSSNPFQFAALNSTSAFSTTGLYNDGRLAFWDSLRNGTYPFDPLLRINYNNISTYACNIATNEVC